MINSFYLVIIFLNKIIFFLDNILSLKINEKGYKTRAAAVEAARFLLLQFKYKINYFYENGRLENINGETYCDAEGRYYHTGLYLNEYKYDELDEDGIVNGPSIWGCDLKSDSNDGIISPNGLDCSGFITWCLYNAGYDPKDIGAGITRKVKDLTNLGKLIYLEDLDYENIKVGDLIGFIGHIGMVIAKDEDGIYIGEVYWENDSNCKYYKYEDLKKSEWDYIIDMDKFYKEDGKLENMW